MHCSLKTLSISLLALLTPQTSTAFSASDIDSNTPVAQLIKSATSALAQGKVQDALTYFDVAVARDPQNYLTIFRRGAAYLSLGKSSQASADFDKVLIIKPNFEGALVQRAKIRSRAGSWDDAKADYAAANKKGGDEWKELEEAQGAEKLATDAQKAGDWEACAAQADVAMRVATASLDLTQRRAKCRLEKGDVLEGLNDLVVLARSSSDPWVYQQVSAIYFYALDEGDNGVAQIRNCILSDPDSRACSKLMKREKKLHKAHKQLNEHAEKGHWNSAVKLLIGAGDETGLLKDVQDETNELREQGLIPKRAPSQLYQNMLEMTCQAYTEINRLKKAKPYCDEALTNNANCLPALISKASRELEEDNFDEALRTLKVANDAHGNNQKLAELTNKAHMLQKRSKQKDYYKVLGVARDADARDIKRAWRKLSVQYHPDKAQRAGITAEEAQKKIVAINEAHEVLADPELRARYDSGDDPNDTSQQRGNPFQGSPFGQGGFQFMQQGGGQPKFFQQGGGGGFHFQGGFPF